MAMADDSRSMRYGPDVATALDGIKIIYPMDNNIIVHFNKSGIGIVVEKAVIHYKSDSIIIIETTD